VQINKYYLSALSAFIIWGFFSLALKPLHDYPSLDILFYRVFLATAMLLLINVVFRNDVVKENLATFKSLTKKEKTRFLSLSILGGFLLVLNWYLFMYAVNHVSLNSASFAYLICPIITTILAFFILKEKLNFWQWLSVGLCIISCAILSYGDLTGLVYSLIIATTFALYLISQRKNNLFDKFIVLSIQMTIASLVLAPFFPKFGGIIPNDSLFYILMIVIVVLFTIIPLFLNLYALKGMNSSTVGILMYTNPLINFFIAVFYFKEEITTAHIISYILILVSIVIFNERILFKRKVLN
jgi:chloramphenicol-sensitive protein RarD